MSAKIKYQKSAHSTATFCTLFKRSYKNSFVLLTPWLNSKAFSKKIEVKPRKNVQDARHFVLNGRETSIEIEI